MVQTDINKDNTVFVLLSFEGPDLYSLAGGLGVRITHLSRTLAHMDFPTHLFFIGDPKGKGEEAASGGNLKLHRWCQWISEYYPKGVYEGEYEKLNDFNYSIPRYIIDQIVKPAVQQKKLVVILGEEWHTAEVMFRLSDALYYNGLRNRVVMFWNANNTFGFERINWQRLSFTTTITTVSRYMKQIMRGMGLRPLVIPNGIPNCLLKPVNEEASARLKDCIKASSVLTKVARWDPDKCWHPAIDAIARLKARRTRTALLARGGIEPHGEEVMAKARSLGLDVQEIMVEGTNFEDFIDAISSVREADIINVKSHCPQDFLRILYHASDGVLANSIHEPFGLVGLETMAAGGIAFTGGTGEDYATPFYNSIVLETYDAKEIEDSVIYLDQHPEENDKIRKAARTTAKRFTWEKVTEILIRKLEFQARLQGVIGVPPSYEGETMITNEMEQEELIPV